MTNSVDPASVFGDIFRKGTWKGAVSSGPGSSLSATALLRPQLAALFEELGIRSLCDAPCGDGTWVFEVTRSLDAYMGVDIVPELIAQNREKPLPATHTFAVTDIISGSLPLADAILSRDSLVHFPLGKALDAIRSMAASGSEYLLATTFPETSVNVEARMGSWRPLNLMLPPFNLPMPLRLLRERAANASDKYNSKSIGVWRFADVEAALSGARPAAVAPAPRHRSPIDLVWLTPREPPRTVFFTVAVGPHRMFAIPYCYSILKSNPDAAVEILVDDVDHFVYSNTDALRFLDPTRVLLRNAPFPASDAPYMRFLYQPRTKAQYVYIGDVDVLILDEGITESHVWNAQRLGLPYSNILRPGGDRLSGLHFTEWDAYYPIDPLPLSMLRNFVGDENLLKLLVERRGHAMPAGAYRPLHGIHMSLNRDRVVKQSGVLTWGVGEAEWKAYKLFASKAEWRELLPLLDPAYRDLITKLESEGRAAFG